MTSLITKNLLINYWKTIISLLIINLFMFPFSIFKVAKVVLSMEAHLPMTVNTSRSIITVSRLNWKKIKIRIIKKINVIKSESKKEVMVVEDSMIKHVNRREVSRDDSVKIRCRPGDTTDDIIDYVWPTALLARSLLWSLSIPVLMTFKIKLTRFKKLERLLLPLKKLMLTMKYKLLSKVSFTVMIKTWRKKLTKSTESWRIYVRVKELSS